MIQTDLLEWVPNITGPRDGETYNEARDRKRLDGQALAVWKFMADSNWHTSSEIEAGTGFNWSSANARLRDFRKPQHGAHTVERKSLGGGVFAYRLIPRGAA